MAPSEGFGKRDRGGIMSSSASRKIKRATAHPQLFLSPVGKKPARRDEWPSRYCPCCLCVATNVEMTKNPGMWTAAIWTMLSGPTPFM